MANAEADRAYENQAAVSVTQGIKSSLRKQAVFLMFH